AGSKTPEVRRNSSADSTKVVERISWPPTTKSPGSGSGRSRNGGRAVTNPVTCHVGFNLWLRSGRESGHPDSAGSGKRPELEGGKTASPSFSLLDASSLCAW